MALKNANLHAADRALAAALAAALVSSKPALGPKEAVECFREVVRELAEQGVIARLSDQP